MGPYDQPKDVLYLAVAPDSTPVVERARVFLEELSTVYEKCRFGRHVRLATQDAPRDGIVRVAIRATATAAAAAAAGQHDHLAKLPDDERRVCLRIIGYCENVLAELRTTIAARDSVFKRRAYYETLARQPQTAFTSLAGDDAANGAMPPPSMGSSLHAALRQPLSNAHASPSSVLSSTSGGPHSAPGGPHSLGANGGGGSSLFVNGAAGSSASPALNADGTLIESLRTPETTAIGTPGQPRDHAAAAYDAQPPPLPPQISDEMVAKAVEEMLADDHPLSVGVSRLYCKESFCYHDEIELDSRKMYFCSFAADALYCNLRRRRRCSQASGRRATF